MTASLEIRTYRFVSCWKPKIQAPLCEALSNLSSKGNSYVGQMEHQKENEDVKTCFLCHSGLVAEPGKGTVCSGPLCWVPQILVWGVLAGLSCCVKKCGFSGLKTQFCGGCSRMETEPRRGGYLLLLRVCWETCDTRTAL